MQEQSTRPISRPRSRRIAAGVAFSRGVGRDRIHLRPRGDCQPAIDLPRDRDSPHDRLPAVRAPASAARAVDRKSTRLNSSHVEISYAVFCLKKKNKHVMVKTNTTANNKKNRH